MSAYGQSLQAQAAKRYLARYAPTEPTTLCKCGHQYVRHFGQGGTCIAGHKTGEASVCPCLGFRRA